jgi:stage II sporulation protein D
VILRRATLLVLLLSGLIAGDGAARFTPPALKGTPQFLVSGHGWGHGVGMGQWGAYGFAQNGYAYDKILAHYYPGTELGTSTVKSMRVLLANTASLTISSTGPWKLKDGTASATTLPAGKVTLNPQLTFKLPDAPEAQTFTGPVTFTSSSPSSPLVFKKPYRGTFTVTSDGTKLTLVNTVPLEQYLYAVVPSEMPKTWLPEALKAQAVTARSYALAVRKTAGLFDVYADTRSQVYGGVNAEAPATTAAVDATGGEVLTYDGRIALTYFCSTSGGRTAAIDDVWKSPPVPYLVSVSDPYDTISPYHDWGPIAFTAAKLKKMLKVQGRLLDVQTTVNASQRVTSVTAIGDKGELAVSGADVRTALGLRSTWFRVGVLALDPLPATTVTYGSRVTLTGLGRGLSDLELEERVLPAVAWTPNRAIRAAADGSFSVAIKAAAPAELRATSGGVSTPSTTVIVAPRVNLKASADLTTLVGAVRPKLLGARVQIQQMDDAAGHWTPVAATTVNAAGRFTVTPSVLGGTYRARVFPGRGWAVAQSREVLVQ